MRSELERRIAAVYAQRREKAELEREARIREVTRRFPGLKEMDDAVAQAGADLLAAAMEAGPDSTSRMEALSGERRRRSAEREAFLAARGVDLDFDQPRWTCDICHDTGLVDDDPPSGRHRRCACHDGILIPMLFERSNLGLLGGMTFEGFDPTLFSDVPDKARHRADASPRANILGIRRACETFCDEFDAPGTRDLLLIGPPGTGKTYLAGAIADRMLKRTRSVLYLGAPQLFEAISQYRALTASFRPDEERLERAAETYDRILEADLLVIDDLGTETPSASRIPELLTVLNTRSGPRHGAARHTVVATNLEAMDIRDAYDERILSRLTGGFAIYRLYGEDVRQTLRRRRKADTGRGEVR